MKKLIALTLCLLMFAGTAMAGTTPIELKQLTDTKTLLVALPEGVNDVDIQDIYDMKVVTFDLEDKSLPNYLMVVSYSDELIGKDITDLTEDEIGVLVSFTAADSEEHAYEVIEMDDGWPGVLVHYEGESDWVDAFTVIEGFIIQVHGYHDDFSELTEEESTFAFTLLDAIDIIDAE